MVHAHEGNVLNLVRDVLAGVAGDSGLEFSRQVMEFLARQVVILNLFDGWGGIDNLVLGHAGNRRAQNDARHVAAAHERAQTYRLELVPNGGHILDLNPVQLDILAVRKVRRGAGIIARDLTHGAQLGRIGTATVEAHTHHEVLVLQLGVGQLGGHLAAQVLVALSIKAQPLEARG